MPSTSRRTSTPLTSMGEHKSLSLEGTNFFLKKDWALYFKRIERFILEKQSYNVYLSAIFLVFLFKKNVKIIKKTLLKSRIIQKDY